MKYVIQITEPKDYSENALATYRALGSVVLDEKPRADADILVIRLKYKIDSSWFNKMPNLKVIATPTTGLNHVDVAEVEKRGIKVISLRGHADFLDRITSTAEHTLGLMLALVRKLPWAFEDVKAGNWNRDAFKGNQLSEKTLGILGLGRLGKMVARYGQALGMKVIAHDPNVSAEEMAKLGVAHSDLNELFRVADTLSVHVMLTEATQDLVKAEHLQLMKPSALLVNTARAEIIANGALEKALREKWIAGAAVEVMWDEAGDGSHLSESELWKMAKEGSNIIIVPHIGGATYEAMQITEDFVAELVKKHLQK